MYNFSILRDLKKMLLLINCCNKMGNQLSVIPQDSKNLTEKKQQQKHRISFKSFRESRHAMLVLALQNLLELSPFRR
jgi:hypothetical protein